MSEQACLCSVGALPENQCPAHPYRERRIKPKLQSEVIRHAACPACVVLGESEHVGKRHVLRGYREVAKALTVGTVYCKTPKFKDADRIVVHNVGHTDGGGMELYLLEGWHSGPFEDIWMEVAPKAAAA